jgi:hypothetical protein
MMIDEETDDGSELILCGEESTFVSAKGTLDLV